MLLKPPRLWYFVIAVRGDSDPGLHSTGSAGAASRLNRWGREEAGGQEEAAGPSAGGLAAGRPNQVEETCRRRQTPSSRQAGVLQNTYLSVRFMGSYLFACFRGQNTGARWCCFLSAEWFGRCLFLTQTCVAIPRNGNFLPHCGKLHLVQRTSLSVFRD